MPWHYGELVSAGPSGWELDRFGEWLRGKSSATAKAYLSDVAAFAHWASRSATNTPGDVSRILLRRYLAYLATRRYARATIARKAAALRTYFAWCRRRGIVTEDPSRLLSAPRATSRLPRVLSRREIGTLLDGPEVPGSSRRATHGNAVLNRTAGMRGRRSEALELRDRAVLELLYAAGLRVGELCGLERAGVDLHGATVRVLGKGDKEPRIPIHERAVALLGRWLSEGRPVLETAASPPGAVFLNQVGRRLGPRDVRSILDRRSQLPTHLRDGGADLRIVQELLGHSSLQTTQVYTHVSKERLLRVYRDSHPRA